MKMKALLMVISFLIVVSPAAAQTFSNWITDSTISSLKVRQAVGKDASGHEVLFIQIASAVPCQMYVTASLCDKAPKDRNDWRFVKFTRRATFEFTYKIANSCKDGFWWWYKDYQ